MANSDDLDIRKLFGLSPEEAQGLGLEAFGSPPADLPETATPLAAAPQDTPASSRHEMLLDDERALLDLLDGKDAGGSAGREAPATYNGHGAPHGLSLAGSVAPWSQPVTPTETKAPAADDADEGRFVVADDADVDVAALFGLSDDEARGLGLDGDADEPATADEMPFPSVPFPTMRLRAVDPDVDGSFADDAEEDTAAALTLELSEYGNLDAPAAAWPTEAAPDEHAVDITLAASAVDAVQDDAPLATLPDADAAPDDVLPVTLPDADAYLPAMAVSEADALEDEAPAIADAQTVSGLDPALLDAFAEESSELLDGLHVELEALERDHADRPALLEIRRIVHTIKGGAKMCGFDTVVTLTHAGENLLDLVADGAVALDDAALGALFECEPLLRSAVQEALAGRAGDDAAVYALAARFESFCHAAPAAPDVTPAAEGEAPAAEPIALVPSTPVTAEAVEPEPMVVVTTDEATPAGATMAELIAARPTPAEPRTSGRRQANSINVDLTKVDAVVAKVTEMAAHRASSHGMIGRLLETTDDARRNVTRLQSLAMKIGNECASLQPEEIAPEDDLTLESYNTLNTLILQLQEAVSDQLALVQGIHDTITNHWSLQATESRVDADIQSALMNIRLIPLSNMRVRLDGVVRQAAEATGKKVRWQLQGGNVSVEKNVFDKLFEPLMHLLRNAVDHGIEPAPGRRAAGKPEAGSITVAAAQDGNQIVLTIADDGTGIVPNKIATLAVDRGIIGADEAGRLSYQQKMDLIFTPGFSTAKEVSHLSGRGVGMDAVREACLRMGGTIEVGSRQGSGTTFTLRLPLSLSVTRGLIIRDSACLMAVPVAQVSALHLVPASDVVETATGRVARLEGQELPVYNLPSLPGAGRSGYIQNGEVNVLQVAHEGGSVGLVIEDVLGEEEILIKAPPALLRPVKTLLGAHVLPDGRVAPVVNLPQMLVDLQPVATLSPPRQPDAADELTALVVDDSMSMRVALTGTLQSAGFKVLTARDGQEALDVLKREGLPGLITLDVEMPRMDGLETLFAIRQMPGAEDLPIFMMTSRGGARHRRAAEQLGATRYFTKPYRDSELSTAARAACMSA